VAKVHASGAEKLCLALVLFELRRVNQTDQVNALLVCSCMRDAHRSARPDVRAVQEGIPAKVT